MTDVIATEAPEVDPDDKERIVPNRRDKRALARKLKRPIVGRTGKPRRKARKTGMPLHFETWKREGFIRELRARGIDVHETVPNLEKAA